MNTLGTGTTGIGYMGQFHTHGDRVLGGRVQGIAGRGSRHRRTVAGELQPRQVMDSSELILSTP